MNTKIPAGEKLPIGLDLGDRRHHVCVLAASGEILAKETIATTLDRADRPCSVVCMRTTLNLDEALLAEAADYAGLKEKTALLHEGLRALIQREAAARLAALGGTDRKAAAAPRRKVAART